MVKVCLSISLHQEIQLLSMWQALNMYKLWLPVILQVALLKSFMIKKMYWSPDFKLGTVQWFFNCNVYIFGFGNTEGNLHVILLNNGWKIKNAHTVVTVGRSLSSGMYAV